MLLAATVLEDIPEKILTPYQEIGLLSRRITFYITCHSKTRWFSCFESKAMDFVYVFGRPH